MESPERNPIVAAAEGQGSPLFNFLCSLSPIKLMKSVHVAQTFSELSFPPPPAIFVTPRVDSQRDSSSLQRSQSKSKVDLVPTQSGSCRQASLQTENRRVVLNLGQRVQGFRKGRDQEEKGHSLGSPCNSPCKLVEEYLADEPVEAELKTVSSSRLPTVCELKASRRSPEDVLSARDLGPGNLPVEEEPAASPDVLYKLLEDDGLQEGRVSSGEDNTEVLQDSQLMESFKAVHLSSKGSIRDKEVLELDQETSDLMFLLSEGADKHPLPHVSLDDLQNRASSIQHMTGYLSSLRKIVNEEAQEIEMDCLAAQMTTDTAASKSTDTSGDQQGGTASKAA